MTHVRSAVILTIGYCYHSRLMREQRAGYRQRLCSVWKEMLRAKPNVKWLELGSEEDLMQTIDDTLNAFVEPMDFGEGTAVNEALRENLFMLLVSIMNQKPILVIGKPGCPKSLAMEVLQNNLNDEVSSEEFFKSMPAMESESISDVPLLELCRSSLFQPNSEDTLLSALHDLLVHASRRCGTALLLNNIVRRSWPSNRLSRWRSRPRSVSPMSAPPMPDYVDLTPELDEHYLAFHKVGTLLLLYPDENRATACCQVQQLDGVLLHPEMGYCHMMSQYYQRL